MHADPEFRAWVRSCEERSRLYAQRRPLNPFEIFPLEVWLATRYEYSEFRVDFDLTGWPRVTLNPQDPRRHITYSAPTLGAAMSGALRIDRGREDALRV